MFALKENDCILECSTLVDYPITLPPKDFLAELVGQLATKYCVDVELEM